MFELKSTSRPLSSAILVGVYSGQESFEHAQSLLDELADLVDTLGLKVVDKKLVKSIKYHPRYLLGSGKAQEIVDEASARKADVIVFDNVITPGQQRNLEKLAPNLAIIDREEVILDIFAKRARSREARLQVELARMEYSLPRLTRAWGHLSRQGSGVGAMGAGETQLETDRRLVRKRIDTLKRELQEVISQRATRRKQRQRRPTPHAAIVGYTNAGKSSLFRKLTGEQVLVEDKLFATLDTTTRNVLLEHGQQLLLTDTVGFVRKLPHRLVESFKATLEESVLADFLVHVLDVSNPAIDEFYSVTMKVLEELGADLKRVITVFNKVDLQKDPKVIASLQRRYPEALFISAQTGEGLKKLLEKMSDFLSNQVTRADFLIPQSRYDLVSDLHRYGSVLSEEYEDNHVRLSVMIPPKLLPQFNGFQLNGEIHKGSMESNIVQGHKV